MRMPPSASVSRPVTSALDLAALAEQRPQPLEGVGHAAAEQAQHDRGHERHAPVQVEQHAQADDRREHAAHQLHQAGADQVADAFGVAHDARQQHAGLRRVEVAHRQAHHLGLHPLAHVGDGALRRHAEGLRQAEAGDRLDDGGRAGHQRNRQQQLGRPFPITSSMTYFDSAGRTMPASRLIIISVRPMVETPAVHPQQLAELAPRRGGVDLLLRRRAGLRGRVHAGRPPPTRAFGSSHAWRAGSE